MRDGSISTATTRRHTAASAMTLPPTPAKGSSATKSAPSSPITRCVPAQAPAPAAGALPALALPPPQPSAARAAPMPCRARRAWWQAMTSGVAEYQPSGSMRIPSSKLQ